MEKPRIPAVSNGWSEFQARVRAVEAGENTPIDGEIFFIQVPQLRSVQKFVHKRVSQWVEQWKELHGENSTQLRTFFVVKFEKIGTGHQIFCTIQLLIGTRVWKGTALAAGLHRALIQSMGHLNVRFERPVTELHNQTNNTETAMLKRDRSNIGMETGSPNVLRLRLVKA